MRHVIRPGVYFAVFVALLASVAAWYDTSTSWDSLMEIDGELPQEHNPRHGVLAMRRQRAKDGEMVMLTNSMRLKQAPNNATLQRLEEHLMSASPSTAPASLPLTLARLPRHHSMEMLTTSTISRPPCSQTRPSLDASSRMGDRSQEELPST